MHPVPINLPAASGQLVTGTGCITFWGIEDTTASSGGVFNLYDGNGTGGRLILPVTTNAGQSFRDFGPPHSVCFEQGVYYDLVSGTYKGQVTVWLGHSCAALLAALAAGLGQ